MLNDVKLVGRVSREIKLFTTSSGKKMVVMNIAINDSYNKEAKPEFISVFLWDKTADYAASYLQVGDLMLVCGRLRNIQKDDKTELTVVGKTISRLSSKNHNGSQTQSEQSESYQPESSNNSFSESNLDDGMENFSDGMVDLDGDIPF